MECFSGARAIKPEHGAQVSTWCTSYLTRAVRGPRSFGRKYQLFIIQLLICAFTYFQSRDTLCATTSDSEHPCDSQETQICLLSLQRCKTSAFWVSFIRLPQTAPGTRLMSIFFLPSKLFFFLFFLI